MSVHFNPNDATSEIGTRTDVPVWTLDLNEPSLDRGRDLLEDALREASARVPGVEVSRPVLMSSLLAFTAAVGSDSSVLKAFLHALVETLQLQGVSGELAPLKQISLTPPGMHKSFEAALTLFVQLDTDETDTPREDSPRWAPNLTIGRQRSHVLTDIAQDFLSTVDGPLIFGVGTARRVAPLKDLPRYFNPIGGEPQQGFHAYDQEGRFRQVRYSSIGLVAYQLHRAGQPTSSADVDELIALLDLHAGISLSAYVAAAEVPIRWWVEQSTLKPKRPIEHYCHQHWCLARLGVPPPSRCLPHSTDHRCPPGRPLGSTTLR